MMYAWSFEARTAEEVERLVRALGRHRYVKEADLRIHFTVDEALSDLPLFAPHAAAFRKRWASSPNLELGSRDPSLWRAASIDEIAAVFSAFWTPGDVSSRAKERLVNTLLEMGIRYSDHEPFASPPEDPPHPELVQLDWLLLPVDELDGDRHRGALAALEKSGESIAASEPLAQEGPVIALPELVHGDHNGVLVGDFLIWSEPPYAYADYVFAGASKSAKLSGPPVGYRDFE
jgi:hypothetical protein